MLGRLFMAAMFMVCAVPAWALTVSPVHIELVSTGRHNRAQVSVINDGNVAVPIEAILLEAEFDENGQARTSKAGDDFLIMPPQALIPPHARQNFRIQWLGNPLIKKSKSYLLQFSQVPVKLPRSKSGVQVVVSIGVLINVAPPSGSPSLNVVASSVVTNKKGQRQPSFTVQNVSNVHGQLRQSTVRLSQGNWSMTIPPASIEQIVGIGLIQPGKRRRFVLPVEMPVANGPLRVRLEAPSRR